MRNLFVLLAFIGCLFSCNDDEETIEPVNPIDPVVEVTPRVVAEFLPNLSDLNLFEGDLSNLQPSEYAFIYQLNTPLFTDYSIKQRVIALPEGEIMEAVDEGLPSFPDNTVIAKTFYYNNDDRDEALGKQIIETRLLIKKDGLWQTGDYIWNADQTEAFLDNSGSTVAINYIDGNGDAQDVNYKIPDGNDCTTCHSIANANMPIGPKLRNLTKDNQLNSFVVNGYISDFNISDINPLPNWEDSTLSLEERSRAYLDVNCASCHSEGSSAEFETILKLTYETPFDDSGIMIKRFDINNRMQQYQEEYSMPFIGTSMVHEEGFSLIRSYINSL